MRQKHRGWVAVLAVMMLICFSGSFLAFGQESQQEQSEVKEELSPDEVWAQKGEEFFKKEDYPAAIECYHKAIKLNPKEISWPLKLSDVLYSFEKFPEALQILDEAWKVFPEAEDRKKMNIAQADVHLWWGVHLGKNYKYAEEITHYELALPLYCAVGDRGSEAATLNNIGLVYYYLGEKEKALSYYEQVLLICRVIRDRGGEATTMYNIGSVYNDLGEKKKALNYFEQALPISRAIGDLSGEANTLNNIGSVYDDWGEKKEALNYYEQVLLIYRSLENRSGIAITLNHMGRVYDDLGEKKESLHYYEQSLSLRRAIGDRKGEATTLNNIGSVYDDLGDKDKALSYYEQALPLRRAVSDREGEATTLNNMGILYSSLGNKESALLYYQQALPLYRAVGDRGGEATTLNNIGFIYDSLGEKEKALSNYQQALPIFVAVGDRKGEAITLNNIGPVYYDLGEKEKALIYFQQALPLHRAVGDRESEATTLNNIGMVYYSLGEQEKALSYYEQALPISVAVDDRAGEAVMLSNLMVHWNDRKYVSLAIFYGKQSINTRQQLRENIVNLDKEIKNNYLKTARDTYRFLINLLLKQRRFDEALQVLDMLKAEEYYQFIQKDSTNTILNLQYQPPAFTPFEAQWQQQFNTHLENISKISNPLHELLITKKEADQNRLTSLQNQLNEANKAYDQFLLQLKVSSAEYDQKVEKGESIGLNLASQPHSVQSNLQFLDKNEEGKSVTLHYYIFENTIYILLTTPNSTIQTLRTSDFNPAILSPLIENYKTTIKDMSTRSAESNSPTPSELAFLTSTELYNLLFKPIEKDIQDYGATNLMVYLDGELRYIPFSALYDGQHYLVQRYRISLLTTSSMLRLHEEPTQNLKILGLVASKSSVGFPALPDAKDEITSIVKENSSDHAGFIEGIVLMDEAFTRASMFQQLKTADFPLVHIASHFKFSAENEAENYLLLGDKQKLTLKDIYVEDHLFQKVDMLVLAACQTAMGTSSGVEIDSFGELAQRSGAKCVVASLWNVADNSTKDLMVAFYRNLKENRFTSKIEALRQAQLELAGLDDLMLPSPIKRNKSVYASPYYWGPFIMMGNWR